VGTLPGFAEKLRNQGACDEDIAAIINELTWLREQALHLPSARLRDWLVQATVTPAEPIEVQEVTDPPGLQPPPWPTGCASLDALTGGGGYGMTVIAGEPKVGKSLLALSSAVEAARHGWRALYVNAELTRSEIANRLQRYMQTMDETVCDQLRILNVDAGVQPNHVIHKVQESLDFDDRRLLIVLDSINRIVDMSQADLERDSGYWGCMRQWSEFARQSAKISEGHISFLVVSELNQQNRVKGRNLEYTADLVVRISSTEIDGIVEIDVPYARSSRGGKLGQHVLSWWQGRFLSEGDR